MWVLRNIEQYLKVLALQDIYTNTLCHIIDQAPAALERFWDEQQRRLSLAAMDKVTKDFTEGKIDKKAVLAVFVGAMYEVDVTCRIDGHRGTINLFQQIDITGSANSAGAANNTSAPDWRASAVCDALVIHRMRSEHAKGACQFSHDETRAAAIRSDATERARNKERLERREQVHRERQAKAAGTGGASNQRTQGGRGSDGGGRGGSSGSGRGRGGRGGGGKPRSDKKTGSANAAAAEPGDGRDNGSSLSADSSQYSSAHVMRLRNGGGNGSGNCAQRSGGL